MKSAVTSSAATRFVSALAFCVALAASAAYADGYYPYGTWSTVQTLSDPHDVVFPPGDEMFVADGFGGRIAVYSYSTGAFIRDFDGSDKPDGKLKFPGAIAVGPDTNLYVADSKANRIAVFDRATGALLRNIGTGLSGPSDLAFGSDGNIYVADTFNNRVQVITTAGAAVKTITGSGSIVLTAPTGVVLTGRVGVSEELYVSEVLRVVVFNPVTRAVRSTAPEWGITYNQPTVQRYGAISGVEVSRLSTADNPFIYVLDRGHLASRDYAVVEKDSYLGVAQATLTGVIDPQGLAWMGSANPDWFLLADAGESPTRKPGIFKTKVASSSGQTQLAPDVATLAAAGEYAGAAPAPDGSYYVSDSKAKKLRAFDASGTPLFSAALPTSATPAGLAVSLDGGEVYVCTPASGTVQVFASDGSYKRTLANSGQFKRPQAIAVRADGSLAIADQELKRVSYVSTATGAAKVDTPTAAVSDSVVSGVAVAADGTTYVSDTYGDCVRQYDADGAYVRTVASRGTDVGFLTDPAGLALNGSGYIFVADAGNNRIQRISLSGGSALAFGSRGSGIGGLRDPWSVAVQPDERVMIADKGNGRVVQARLDTSKPVTAFEGDVNVPVNHSVTVTLTATDEGSGPAYTYYRLNGGAVQTYSSPILVSAEGTTSIAFWSVDRVGNTETSGQMVYAKIDYTPPVGTTIFGDGVTYYRKPGPIHITSNYSDATQMRLGTVANPGPYWLDITPDATVTVTSEGMATLLAEYRDQALNVTTRTYECVIDGTGPTTAVAPSGALAHLGLIGHVLVSALPQVDGHDLPVYTGAVTISLPATDALSPVVHTYYKLDGGEQIEYFTPFSVDNAGEQRVHVVEAWSVDAAGNTGGHTIWKFGISRLPLGAALLVAGASGDTSKTTVPWSAAVQDAVTVNWDSGSGFAAQDTSYNASASYEATVPPTEGQYQLTVRFRDSLGTVVDVLGEITLDQTPPQTFIGLLRIPSGWSSAPTRFTLLAVDIVPPNGATPSGIAGVRYRLDEGTATTYTAAVLESTPGTHTLSAWAVDRAGNISASSNTTFTVSRLPEGGAFTTSVGSSIVSTTTVTMTTTIKDAVRMRWTTGSGWSAGPDASTWTTFTPSFVVTMSGEGPKTVKAEFVDVYSQVNTLTASVTIDRTGPTVTIARSPVATASAGPTTMSMGAVDNYSAIGQIRYTAGGLQSFVYTTPRVFTNEGLYTIEASATDALGNRGPLATKRFIITKLLLGGTVSVAGGAQRTSAATVSATVAAQSAKYMRWSTGGDFTDWVPYTTSAFNVHFTGEGEQTLTVELQDRFGVEIESSDKIIVDTSPPVTRFVGYPEGGVSNGPVILHFSATDLSPVAYTEYSLDGAAWKAYLAPAVVSSGSHSIRYRSRDTLGWLEPAQTATFTVAATSPSGATMRLSGGRSFVNTTTVQVALGVPDALNMKFDTGSGWSAETTYATTAALVLPADGFYWVVASVTTSTGPDVVLRVPIVVDRTAPSLTSLASAIRNFRIVSGVFRYSIGLSAKAADPAPLASSFSAWKWTLGTYVSRTRTATTIYGPRAGLYSPTVAVADRAGNLSSVRGRLRLGAAPAPVVPRSAYAGRYFAVKGYVPLVSSSGSAYRVWCYQLSSNGVWYLRRSFVPTARVSGSYATLSRSIYLGRGTWRVVLGTYKGAYLYAGTPSQALTVR